MNVNLKQLIDTLGEETAARALVITYAHCSWDFGVNANGCSDDQLSLIIAFIIADFWTQINKFYLPLQPSEVLSLIS